jgi:hypothetical protein
VEEAVELATRPGEGLPRFNWGAFMFPVLWPLAYRLPGLAALAFLVPLAVDLLAGWFVPGPSWVPQMLRLPVSLAACIYVGLQANPRYWRRHPELMTIGDFRARQRKWVAWGVALTVIGGAFALVSITGVSLGSQSATYAAIATPAAVEQINRESFSLVARSMGGLMAPARTDSKSLVRDAEGKPYPGGEDGRETQATTTVFFPRWPFVASVEAWGWGTPAGSYRLDVDVISVKDLVNYTNTTVERGMAVSEVDGNRDRIAELFSQVLRASDLDGVYDARSLAQGAKVVSAWQGDGIVAVAALLPATGRVSQQGSLCVWVGRDWQIESFNVWTDDTFAYKDATNPGDTAGDPLDPSTFVAP